MRGSAVARDVASSSPSKHASALDMMSIIGSGDANKKPAAPAHPVPRSSKDDVVPPAIAIDSSSLAAFLVTTSLEPKSRARAPQTQAQVDHAHVGNGQHPSSDHSDPASPSSTGAGELLPQWGQNKRVRCRRDSTSASPQRRHAGGNKIPRRSSSPAADKLMPPPSAAPYTCASNLRSASPRRFGSSVDAHHARPHPHLLRSVEDRAGGKGKFSTAAAARAEKQRVVSPPKVGPGVVMGLGVPDLKPQQQQHNQGGSGQQHQAGAATASKLEVTRIYTTLSRKEKEDDFMAFKGTKLPQRPKRRPKNVEKAVNAICPGMWLTDVTSRRYEVREKKCPKKQLKNRGLKGLEILVRDSDSD